MNLKEILEKFAEMQEYAESNNTNASLWWHYFEAGQTYKIMEYATTIEKVENVRNIEGDDGEMLDITLRFADNKLDKLEGYRYKGILEESKTYFSIGFCMGNYNTTYFPMTEFSETSIVGKKYNHLKAYTETPTVELSKMEIIKDYRGSRKVLLQDYFYCTFDNPVAVSVNGFGQIIY